MNNLPHVRKKGKYRTKRKVKERVAELMISDLESRFTVHPIDC